MCPSSGPRRECCYIFIQRQSPLSRSRYLRVHRLTLIANLQVNGLQYGCCHHDIMRLRCEYPAPVLRGCVTLDARVSVLLRGDLVGVQRGGSTRC